MKCPVCGMGKLIPIQKKLKVHSDDVTSDVSLAYGHCPICNEDIYLDGTNDEKIMQEVSNIKSRQGSPVAARQKIKTPQKVFAK